MIFIANGATALYQWERGVTVNCDTPCDVVSFVREGDNRSVRDVPQKVQSLYRAEIPRELLQQSGYLRISAIDISDDGERVVDTARLRIRARKKPDDYPAGGQETAYWQTLQLRMQALERKAREGEFKGEPGDDGITPHIGANGNWFAGETDLGVPAHGVQGEAGEDGITPHIGENGNWYIGEIDTGVLASGLSQLPSIGANGNWFIGGVDTGIAATGGSVDTSALEAKIKEIEIKATAAQNTATSAQNTATSAQNAAIEANNAAERAMDAVGSKAPAYTYGTTDLTAGTSPLETGKLYFVYE